MQGLKERHCTPQAVNNSEESLNSTSANSMPMHHGGCGCNFRKEASISGMFLGETPESYLSEPNSSTLQAEWSPLALLGVGSL